MRMVTESLRLSRRAWCQGLGGSALAVLAGGSWVNAGATPRNAVHPGVSKNSTKPSLFAACWDDAQGAHHAGWLQVTDSGGTVSVLHATELPTRGHGLALLPDGALLVVARRPGDWLVRLAAGQQAQWLWQEPGRVFSGHVHVAADGLTVFTTEIDTQSGQGLLGVRDASTLQKRAEFMTNGLDPHAVLALPATHLVANTHHTAHPLSGMLFVANGGINTAPETGRVKRHLAQMDASIACLHPKTGELLSQWRLTDQRLSLRHLAWAMPDAAHPPAHSPSWPVLGVALQAEHDDPLQKAAAPLLATLSWAETPQGQLQLARGQPALAGYGGDIVVTRSDHAAPSARQFVVSATRGHQLACFALDGQFISTHALPDAGALAQSRSTAWAGGRDEVVQLPLEASRPVARTTLGIGKLDNHWLGV